jgi:hypothetical protein
MGDALYVRDIEKRAQDKDASSDVKVLLVSCLKIAVPLLGSTAESWF